MTSLNTNLYLFLENLIFFLLATSLIVVLGWTWRDAKPVSPPNPLPTWLKIWFRTVQLLGLLLPLLVMLLWGVWWGYASVLTVLSWYLINIGLQVLSEIVTLRQFPNVVWVMVPYVYLPYRFWQLYESWTILGSETELLWVRNLLVFELVLWIVNYALDVSQLPRLFRWEVRENSDLSSRSEK
jgi:hypothetical protein